MDTVRARRAAVAAPPQGGSVGEAAGTRSPEYAALADALAARDAEILEKCQEKYLETVGGHKDDSWRRDPLWKVTSLGTLSIVRWLQTGELANLRDRTKIASVGLAAAQRELVAQEFAQTLEPVGVRTKIGSSPASEPPPRAPDDAAPLDAVPEPRAEDRGDRTVGRVAQLSVTLLTKLNFWWSDITCGVLAEESARLEADPRILREASVMVVKSSQASLVDMAKRFDSEIEMLHRRLAELALRDPLTGLPNRTLLIDQLDRALARLSRQPAALGLVFVDVDDFKAVNDVYGHACGDAVLVELAARLIAGVRPGDVVARLGGDEFVVLLEGLHSPVVEAGHRAEELRAAAALPMSFGGSEVRLTVSAGVATVHQPGKESEEVLTQADAAMYSAKRVGRNRVVVTEIDDTPHVVRFATTSDLHRAVDRHELRLVYQPLYDSRKGTVVGFEALLRWEHPEKGIVPPLEFIPVAEKSGLMVAIGEWVLEEACRQAMVWSTSLHYVPRMAVNVSARQLDDREFVRRVSRILERTGMPPASVMLELTESMLLSEDADHEATLSVLKDLGVHLAIDDFGTGYSSLAYLRRLPVDQLKVDRAFVKDVADHGDTRIMEAVVRLAHDLGLEVVAEGVETSDELDVVKELGCDIVQGFLLGRPLPPAAVALEHASTPEHA
ncbi:MAG: putative bifunctional diguanylate cyclase/phosphodiesterase [Acidimicrobiales bacterium]